MVQEKGSTHGGGLKAKKGTVGERSFGREDRKEHFAYVVTLPRASADTDHSIQMKLLLFLKSSRRCHKIFLMQKKKKEFLNRYDSNIFQHQRDISVMRTKFCLRLQFLCKQFKKLNIFLFLPHFLFYFSVLVLNPPHQSHHIPCVRICKCFCSNKGYTTILVRFSIKASFFPPM